MPPIRPFDWLIIVIFTLIGLRFLLDTEHPKLDLVIAALISLTGAYLIGTAMGVFV